MNIEMLRAEGLIGGVQNGGENLRRANASLRDGLRTILEKHILLPDSGKCQICGAIENAYPCTTAATARATLEAEGLPYETATMPAGVADAMALNGWCGGAVDGRHNWLPWWTEPSGQAAHTVCGNCGKRGHVSVLP